MQQYNKDVKKITDKLVEQILKGNLSKRRINELIAKYAKKLKMPTEKFIERLHERATKSADDAKASMILTLMGLNKQALITDLTAKEVQSLVDVIFAKEIVFTRWKNKDKKSFIRETYDLNKWLSTLPKTTAEQVRKRMMGSFINGDTPAQMASSLKDKNATKKVKRNIKTMYETIQYRARNLSNIEIMKKNEKYIGWVEWVTVDDIRVDEVCVALSDESVEKKYKPSELPLTMMPPSHFNCRCSLQPRIKGIDRDKHVSTRIKKIWVGEKIGRKCTKPSWLVSGMKYSNIKKVKGKCEWSYYEYVGD